MQNLAIGLVLIGLALLVVGVLVLYQFAPELGLTQAPPAEAATPEEEDATIELVVGGEIDEINREAAERLSLDHMRTLVERQPGSISARERETMDDRRRFQHTVLKGETLSSLAREYLGDAALWRAILDANPSLTRPEDLREGQIVLIPTREAK